MPPGFALLSLYTSILLLFMRLVAPPPSRDNQQYYADIPSTSLSFHLPRRSRPLHSGRATNTRHPDGIIQYLAHLDGTDRTVTPAVPITVSPGALARARLLQLKAERRVRRLVGLEPAATPLRRRALPARPWHAQRVRTKAVKIRLQRQVRAGVRGCLLMAATTAVPRGRQECRR